MGIMIPAALVTGTLTGLVGVGGGFLIVPALTGVLGLSMAEATATSLSVIALSTAAAGAGYVGSVSLDPVITAIITAVAMAGCSRQPDRAEDEGSALTRGLPPAGGRRDVHAGGARTAMPLRED